MTSRRWVLGLLLLTCLGAALYLIWAWAQGGLGFPLDDAWIHQTYARSLAQTGRWTYAGEQVSAGSTSPLWTLLLVPGHLLGLDPRAWAYSLGVLCLFGSGWLVFRLGVALGVPERPAWFLGALIVTEWHLVWASLSGMETALFVFLALALVYGWFRKGLTAETRWVGPASRGTGERHAGNVAYGGERKGRTAETQRMQEEEGEKGEKGEKNLRILRASAVPMILGLVAGLLVLTRPDGVLLVGWLALASLGELGVGWFAPQKRGGRRGSLSPCLRALGAFAGSFLLTLIPYLVGNWLASGTLWPNTFYAKQAEYRQVLQALSVPERLVRLLGTPWVGAQVLLLPGLLALVWPWQTRTGDGARASCSPWLLAILAGWWVTVVVVYAMRLPVTYQHGRYLMPVIPALLILGGMGSYRWLRPSSARLLAWLASRAWLLGMGVLVLAFLVLGARAYSWDVRFIETELVATAHWLRANTPADSLVAVHDIGAVGYFAERDLVDLAGLASPEVVPFIRDEEALLEYVLGRGADYLVTFPSWYPQMVQDPRLRPVWKTGAPWAPALGGENVGVYQVTRQRGVSNE